MILYALEACLTIMPKRPPEEWVDDILRKVRAKARALGKRLEFLLEMEAES